MIREIPHIKKYPSKTVLEDVSTRIGPATEDSWTPFNGKKDELHKQFRGEAAHTFRIEDFISHNANLEFVPRKSKAKKYVGGMELNEVDDSLDTLESFMTETGEHPKILQWFQNCCAAYRMHKTSPFRHNDKMYGNISVNNSDDDSVMDPRMFQVIEPMYSLGQEDYDNALKRLPFYVKAIWQQSRLFWVDLFSFARGYKILLDNSNNGVITVRDWALVETYALDKHGNHTKRFTHSTDIKTPKYTDALQIFLQPDLHREVYGLIVSYLELCKTLGIEITKQDPCPFNNDNVSRLVSTYLPSMEEYVNYYGVVDSEVIYAIKSSNIFSKRKIDIYQDRNLTITENKKYEFLRLATDRLEIIRETLSWRFDPYLAPVIMGDFDHAKELIKVYFKLVHGISDFDIDSSVTVQGMFVYTAGRPLELDATPFLSEDDELYNATVLVTAFGSIMLNLASNQLMKCMPYEDAMGVLLDEKYSTRRWIDI